MTFFFKASYLFSNLPRLCWILKQHKNATQSSTCTHSADNISVDFLVALFQLDFTDAEINKPTMLPRLNHLQRHAAQGDMGSVRRDVCSVTSKRIILFLSDIGADITGFEIKGRSRKMSGFKTHRSSFSVFQMAFLHEYGKCQGLHCES